MKKQLQDAGARLGAILQRAGSSLLNLLRGLAASALRKAADLLAAGATALERPSCCGASKRKKK